MCRIRLTWGLKIFAPLITYLLYLLFLEKNQCREEKERCSISNVVVALSARVRTRVVLLGGGGGTPL